MRTYQEVALAAGSPRAARSVGEACRKNPLPLLIPCHRVVRSGTTRAIWNRDQEAAMKLLGNYQGGTQLKYELLNRERLTSLNLPSGKS